MLGRRRGERGGGGKQANKGEGTAGGLKGLKFGILSTALHLVQPHTFVCSYRIMFVRLC